MVGWILERRWFLHSYIRIRMIAAFPLIMFSTDPCHPCTTVATEYYLPCWLERLEKLIRLKEGDDAERIEDAKGDQEEEDV